MQRLWAGVVFAWKGYRNFGKRGYEIQSQTWDPKELEVDLSKKIAIVTGANSGLGKCAALFLASRGANVHILCRNKERGEEARNQIIEETKNENIHLHVVDVSESKQIIEFGEKWLLAKTPINILVNNAGVLLSEKKLTSENFETIFATNLLGGFELTQILLPALAAGGSEEDPARVINVSSGGMYAKKLKVEDMENDPAKFDGVDLYANTKRAQVFLTELWAAKYSETIPVRFFSMHPGWAITPGVETSLPGFFSKMQGMMRTAEQGADTINWLSVASGSKLKSGEFYFDRQIAQTHFTGGSRSPLKDVQAMWEKLASIYTNNLANLNFPSETKQIIEPYTNLEFPNSFKIKE